MATTEMNCLASGGGGKTFMSAFSDMSISVPARSGSVLIPVATIGFVPSKVVISSLGEVGTITAYEDGAVSYSYQEYRGTVSASSCSISVDSTGITFSVDTITQTVAYLMCSE